MKNHRLPRLFATLLLLISASFGAAAEDKSEVVRFTSAPDIFNWNIDYPTPGWEDTMDWYFKKLKSDGPDFTLAAGDIMDARWYEPELIKKKTEQYWGGYVKRFKDYDITAYVAMGDHEYGDDRGLTMGNVSRLFGKQFEKIMGMPKNGPEGHVGRAFWVREGGLLVITLDTFEDVGKRFAYTVGDKQLKWMEQVLRDNKDADFVLVQGHLPIVGPVKSKNSSASMMKGGTNNKLWKLMVKYGVDAYLCGEHHRITVHHHDGIWQIVHGALWGTQTDVNYMRGVVADGEMTLELLEFDVEYSGGHIGDHPHRGKTNKPRENVKLSAATKKDGPRVTGKLVIKAGKSRAGNNSTTATGWFAKPAEAKR
ncbi:MAG: metallophosphoesterase [Planctomycetota bacterium]